ncbi:MAG TPA: FAD-dependent oxidoreductase [Mycobacteriales bacterium]|nr:FAD-dependent oxidoreductase [Mycobacteriales bacterium]
MRSQIVESDITVVGGGLAGVCAAVAAARLGKKVALINNRPVLGGNSSSEVRVWVCGATGHGSNRNAREGGIMGEMFVENQFRNPDGNPYYWDLVVLETVRAEPNITVFLNTDVREIFATGPKDDRRVESVTGWTMGSEITTRFHSPIFLDCTGDGLIGHLAGAEYRIGREGRDEYGESFAPEVADDLTLGSTLLFYTKDTGAPAKYVAPSFAKDITKTSIPEKRIIKAGDNGCAYWWIEWGGEHDIVDDNEMIRDELWAAIYGIWDYIKNSGKFDAENMALEWVGALPGKREYRRFLGDHVLTQNDIMDQVEFDDRVAIGGWSIDLHPPRGMYAPEAGSKHRHAKGIYHVPFRSLYSRNVGNLLLAGRDISATHVAFGSTRVMATCANIGEGAGTAAALCHTYGITPRELSRGHSPELVRTLLRQDAGLVGLPLQDPEDLIASAELSANNTLTRIERDDPADRWDLEADLGFVIPVEPRVQSLQLMVDARADTELTVELYDPGLGQNYVPERLVVADTVALTPGEKQWVTLQLPYQPEKPGNAFIRIVADPQISVYMNDLPTPGMLCMSRVPLTGDAQEPVKEWSEKPVLRKNVCLRVEPETNAYSPDKVMDGYARPFAGPHEWVSAPLADGPAELTASWPHPQAIRQVDLVFDDDVNEDLINLHHHRTPFETMPSLVRDYRLQARIDGAWVDQQVVTQNRTRHHRHVFTEPVWTDALRLVIEATNGDPWARVVALRAYPEPLIG